MKKMDWFEFYGASLLERVLWAADWGQMGPAGGSDKLWGARAMWSVSPRFTRLVLRSMVVETQRSLPLARACAVGAVVSALVPGGDGVKRRRALWPSWGRESWLEEVRRGVDVGPDEVAAADDEWGCRVCGGIVEGGLCVSPFDEVTGLGDCDGQELRFECRDVFEADWVFVPSVGFWIDPALQGLRPSDEDLGGL